jgi:hypothetical protein
LNPGAFAERSRKVWMQMRDPVRAAVVVVALIAFVAALFILTPPGRPDPTDAPPFPPVDLSHER